MKTGQKLVSKFVIIMLSLLLIVNMAILARVIEIIRFPGELSDWELSKMGAEMVAGYYESIAEKAGLLNNPAVREELYKFKFAIEDSRTNEEIGSAIVKHGRELQNLIEMEREEARRNVLLQIINSDETLKNMSGVATIVITNDGSGNVKIEDDSGILSDSTHKLIAESDVAKALTSMLEIRVIDGKVYPQTSRTLLERVDMLQSEVDKYRSSLEELQRSAGFAPITGPGIVIEIYDASNGLSSDEAVQEKDIRDIVNELFSAGAQGIQIGNQRIIATTSIRGAGSQILVNHKPITVNPVVIKAVGDPTVLESSLQLIANNLKPWGIRLEIRSEQMLTLVAYRKN